MTNVQQSRRRCKNGLTNGEGNSMDSAQTHPLGELAASRAQPAEQKTATEQDSTFTREDLRKDTYVRETEPRVAPGEQPDKDQRVR